MLGFIELHFRLGKGEPPATATPFLQAVASIVRVEPLENCAVVSYLAGDALHEEHVQESYDEVFDKLKEFQRAAASAGAPQKPFVRTHKR